VIRQNKYWAKHPPVHILVAAYMGFNGKTEEPEVKESLNAFEEAKAATADQFPKDLTRYLPKQQSTSGEAINVRL
jgi:hypothetical protein